MNLALEHRSNERIKPSAAAEAPHKTLDHRIVDAGTRDDVLGIKSVVLSR